MGFELREQDGWKLRIESFGIAVAGSSVGFEMAVG